MYKTKYNFIGQQFKNCNVWYRISTMFATIYFLVFIYLKFTNVLTNKSNKNLKKFF